MASQRSLSSVDTLTEFAPLQAESKPVSSFFSRLFKKTAEDIAVDLKDSDSDSVSTELPSIARQASNGSTSSESSPASDSPQQVTVTPPSRTPSGVLKRLSTILDRRSQTPQAYKDSDFRQFWMPDKHCQECYECSERFNTFRRRHHCRICGQIFCSRCCNQVLPGNIMGYTGHLRVCTYCCKVVLSYTQYQDASGDLLDLSCDPQVTSDMETSEVISPESVLTPTGSVVQRKRQRASSPSGVARQSILSSNPFDVTPLAEYGTAETFQKERIMLLQDSAQLRDLCVQIQHPSDGIQLQSHRFRLRTYSGCLLGSELVDWLLARDKATSRAQAIAIGQALVDAKWLECVAPTDQLFRDTYALYRPGETAFHEVPSGELECRELSGDEAEPLWFREIQHPDEDESYPTELSDGSAAISNSIFYVEQETDSVPRNSLLQNSLSIDANALSSLQKGRQDSTDASFVRVESGIAGMTVERDDVTSTEPKDDSGWHSEKGLTDRNDEKLAFVRISALAEEHTSSILNQLLRRANLSAGWTQTILGLAKQVTSIVKPDVRYNGDNMDIRQYVSIKKIPGGSPGQTSYIRGVVCTKNVAHKRMRTHIPNPNILLLQAPIVYQRIENKFSSLAPQILQEEEYLKNCVARIAALEPDILLVGKTVSRVAQTFLLDCGITLVLNVKTSVMERVSRLTQAEIVKSIDSLVTKTAMGSCHLYKIQQHRLPDGAQKALMYFDGCPPHLGCTITLRGGSAMELKQVKKVLQFIIYVAYHNRLERSFLMDEFALPTRVPNQTNCSPDFSPSNADDEERHDTNAEEKLSPDIDAMASLLSCQSADDENSPLHMATPSAAGTTTPTDSGSMANKAEESSPFESIGSIKVDTIPVLTGVVRGDARGPTGSAITEPNVENTVQTTEFNSHECPIQQVSDGREQATEMYDTSSLQQTCTAEVVSTQPVNDFSDPLRRASHDDPPPCTQMSPPCTQMSPPCTQMSPPCTQMSLRAERDVTPHRFRDALNAAILSISPLILYELPYLETAAGSRCLLRRHLPTRVYQSPDLELTSSKCRRSQSVDTDSSSGQLYRQRAHQFVTQALTAPLRDHSIQALWADFRARGSRLATPHSCNRSADISAVETVQAEVAHEKMKIDCLDPYQHQRLAVCLSSFSLQSANAPNPCVSPRIVSMEFYGCNAVPLGGFLERFCFIESYNCPSVACKTPMTEHIRRFVHGSGCLKVILKHLDSSVPLGKATDILMWSWCRICKQVTPVVAMSTDTWSMSFTKYLDLRFHGVAYGRRGSSDLCTHSLHHDHYQYFGQGNIVASFQYSQICLKEIGLPPMLISIKHDIPDFTSFTEHTKQLAHQGTAVFADISGHLDLMKKDTQTDMLALATDESIAQLQKEAEEFQQRVQQTLETGQAADCDEHAQLYELQDCLVQLKHCVADTVLCWNHRITELDQQLRRAEKVKALSSSTKRDSALENSLPTNNIPSIRSQYKESSTKKLDPDQTAAEADIRQTSSASSFLDREPTENSGKSQSQLPSSDIDQQQSALLLLANATPPGDGARSCSYGEDASQCTEGIADEHSRQRSSSDTKKLDKNLISEGGTTDRADKRGAMKNIFNRVLTNSGPFVITMPFDLSEHFISMPTRVKFPLIIYDQEPSSIIAFSLSSVEYENKLQTLRTQLYADNDNCSPSPKRNRLTELSTSTNSDAGSIADIKKSSSGVLSFFRVATRERSPNRPAVSMTTNKYDVDSVKYVPRLERDVSLDETDFSFFSGPEQDKAKPGKQAEANTHIELQFCDNTAKFYCRVYFADEFHKLRKLIFPAGEESYIRSLSRCFTWLARGGKSGLTFCKTQDDRFILKQMSHSEVQSFVKFAPHYIQYITDACNEQKPTMLAKILGVYRIGYHNTQTNAALKQDLLVMENLFYGHQITQVFDLKGSMRNRLVNTYGKQVRDLVLLDENLLKSSLMSPLYIRAHSKTIVNRAIDSDTHFLSSNLIIDYSLLVGLDEVRKQLVVGIIDYIRTFTWDKKLEMVVKTTYSQFGGQGKMPTVVSPELYRSRFRLSMDRYFIMVPDQWTGLETNSS